MKSSLRQLNRYKALYIMLIPGICYFLLFRYVPIAGASVAFKQFNFLEGYFGSPWIGFDNFMRFFNGMYFEQILTNTIVISLYKLVFGFPAPIILALMLDQVRLSAAKRTFQTLTYIPHFMSWVIIYGIMLALLSPGDGLVNQLLKENGFETIAFLTDSGWIRTLLVSSDIWYGSGWGAIIYLAALAGIDPHLYEAATTDGAGTFRKLWHITLPGIRSIIMVMLILKLSHILDVGFDQVFMMMNALNMEKADIIDTWVYRVGLLEMQIGLASAVGLFKSVIGFVLVLGANHVAKRFDSQIW